MIKGRVDQALERVLRQQPVCFKQAALLVYSVETWVCLKLNRMHRAGLVHIVGWNDKRPVFVWGEGEDVQYVRRRGTDAQRKQASRSKRDVATKDFAAARRRQQRRTIKVDPLISAFFGVSKP